MISWRLVQSENAENPILVTLSGIVIFVRLAQPMKAYLSIVVTVSGIVYSVTSLPAGKHISLFYPYQTILHLPKRSLCCQKIH